LYASQQSVFLLERITQHLLALVNDQRVSDAEFDKRLTQCTFRPFLYASTDWRNGTKALKITRFDKLITPACLDVLKQRISRGLNVVEEENVSSASASASAASASVAA
jgi:hypothetical protein